MAFVATLKCILRVLSSVLNLLLVLRVLAARAFRGLRILLLALGLVLNQPLFDRLLATKGVRIDRDIALRAHEPRDRKRPRPRRCPLVGRRRSWASPASLGGAHLFPPGAIRGVGGHAPRMGPRLRCCSELQVRPRLLRGPDSAANSTCLLVFVYRLFTVCLRTLEAWVVCSQTVLFTNSLFSCLFTELCS